MALIALIADGGADAGLGHISRCSALAVALERAGAKVRAVGLGLPAPLDRYGIRWQPVAEPDLAGADAVVLDSYRADSELRLRIASSAPLAVFADDDGAFSEAALVIRAGPATGRAGELAGLRYACLGPGYWSIRPRAPRRRAERVLVATGAADHADVGPGLATAVHALLPESEVVLVRGPYAPAVSGLDGVRVACSPETLLGLLVEADIVISAAGQTMIEALAVGTPCTAVITAENQRRQADELLQTGALTVATTVEQAARAAACLAEDYGARCAQASLGRRIVDGRGAVRTAEAVVRLVSRA